jgi:hypothetical protein
MLYKMASNNDHHDRRGDNHNRRGDHHERRHERGSDGDQIGQYLDGLRGLIDSEVERKVNQILADLK